MTPVSKRFDLGLELRQRFGIAGRWLGGFELRDARFEASNVRLCHVLCAAKAAPGQGETDDADEAAEHAGGKMGDEAFQLRNAGLSGRQRLRLGRIGRVAG